MSYSIKCKVLIGSAAFLVLLFLLLPKIAQNPAYHSFADTRTIFGIPNFFDVISNLPFLAAALLGFAKLKRLQWPIAGRRAFFIFLVGVAATCLGSMHYHWRPSTESLFWDRLPMTVAFMGFFNLLIALRVSEKWAARLLGPLLLLGLSSVVYWSYSESIGAGDLRAYILVQFGMILLSLLVLLLFPGKRPAPAAVNYLLLSYVVAKVFEAVDGPLYALTAGQLSGHTLKHLAAGLGCWLFVRWMDTNDTQHRPN